MFLAAGRLSEVARSYVSLDEVSTGGKKACQKGRQQKGLDIEGGTMY
jgi:hypothetical protein